LENSIECLDFLKGYQRQYVLSWNSILKDTAGMKKKELWFYCSRVKNEVAGIKISANSIYDKRAKYNKYGILGLIPGWGKRSGKTKVPQEAAEIFHSLVLQDTAPSFYQAYVITLGQMQKTRPGLTLPGLGAFMRFYKNSYRPHQRDLARRGIAYYQRNWEYYIERTCDKLEAGKGFFSDHHQLDNLMLMPDGKQERPWVTVWRDIRSGKMLGWFLHRESPAADHIFYAFYLAAREFGLPDFIYIDNGKDYRCRDFSGCYKNVRPWNNADEAYAKSLMGLLNIEVVFATAYNAQAKSVERDFRRIIEQFSKFMAGYTGSNPSRRPESTDLACKKGNLLTFREGEALLDRYFLEIFNKTISNGKLLAGMCPDEAFAKYRKSIRAVSADSLKICAMRTAKTKSIDRNGVTDTELGIELRYWAEFMYSMRGEKVVMRRDIRAYQEAWFWRESDGMYLGKAALATPMPMRATTDLEKTQLKNEIARKRLDMKEAKAAIQTSTRLSAHEVLESMVMGTRALNNMRQWEPEAPSKLPTQIQTTILDHAAAEEARMKKTGTYDMADLVPEPSQKKKLIGFEYEKKELSPFDYN
jgi:hypothetical protein